MERDSDISLTDFSGLSATVSARALKFSGVLAVWCLPASLENFLFKDPVCLNFDAHSDIRCLFGLLRV